MRQYSQAKEVLNLIQRTGVTKTSDLESAGLPRRALTRLVHEGSINRLGRGLYAVPDLELSEWHDLAEISKTAPAAIVSLISALSFHNIGTQLPYETWITLPVGTHRPAMLSHGLRITWAAEPYYSAGIEEHTIEGVKVRVYNAAKTVADCFKMRGKVGYDVAVEALREGWRERKFTMDELNKFAKLNRVERVVRPYIEAIIE